MADASLGVEGESIARAMKCRFIETSAKSRINVDNAFYNLVREIRRYNKEMAGYPAGGGGGSAMAGGGSMGGGQLGKLEMDGEGGGRGCCGSGRCAVM